MILVPSLYIGWFAKIVVDHVILEVPLVADEASFPPHFHWFLVFLEGREPIIIASMLLIIYVFGVFLIGSRTGGTGADLYAGRDAASYAENAVSGGVAERSPAVKLEVSGVLQSGGSAYV